MKKFFAIAIIAVSLAACNNSGDASKTEDTSAVKPDTSTMAPVDTTTHVDTSALKK